MVDPIVVREWIKKADDDFDFALYTTNDTVYYAHACFHFQQAAEKYLKALIVAKELPFVKTHIMVALLKICEASGYRLEGLSDAANFLDGCYIATRYPVHWPNEYTKENALMARDAAEKVKLAVLAVLSLAS